MTAPARPTASSITDDQLDALYAERDRLRIEADRLYTVANLRTCLWPGCRRQYDALSWASGEPPARPEWSGRGWHIAKGLLPGDDRVCPDHAELVTAHRHQHSRDRHGLLAVTCACGQWSTGGHHWHRVARALWEQHLLTVAGELPAHDATMNVIGPELADQDRRIRVLEHVARGNKRHAHAAAQEAQALHADLDARDEQIRHLDAGLRHERAAIDRVRAECDAIVRDRASLDPDCETFGDGMADATARIRIALGGTDTPEETSS